MSEQRWKSKRWGVLLLSGGLAWLAPGDVNACLNGTYSRMDTGIAWARVVEGNLSRGKHDAVVDKILARHPRVHAMQVGGDALNNRVLRLMALALVRLEGKAPKKAKDFPSSSPAEITANLDWAIERLRKLYARHDDDATLRCDLGEALASRTDFHTEAFKLLDNLEQRDLVVSSAAYSQLAKLRRTRHAGSPSFIAAATLELDRARIELEEAQSLRMHGNDLPRPMNRTDVQRSQPTAPAMRHPMRKAPTVRTRG